MERLLTISRNGNNNKKKKKLLFGQLPDISTLVQYVKHSHSCLKMSAFPTQLSNCPFVIYAEA